MEIKAARRLSVHTDLSVFKRLGKENRAEITRNHVNNVVCKYWLAGRCSRNPCRFLHPELAKTQPKQSHTMYRPDSHIDNSKHVWKNSVAHDSKKSAPQANTDQETHRKELQKVLKGEVDGGRIQTTQKTLQKVCKPSGANTMQESEKQDLQKLLKSKVDDSGHTSTDKAQEKLLDSGCTSTDKAQEKLLESTVDCSENQTDRKALQEVCNYLDTQVSLVARLEGHTKAITGIALPYGSDKLYCGSKDKSLRVWDCNSGQCAVVVDLGGECGTLISNGPWIFVTLQDNIKAWNLETQSELTLRGDGGLIDAIAISDNVLFAGMEDGSILAWRSLSETSFSEVASSLKGHSGAVISLVVGAKKLFSGSTDHTIRVWDPESLKCMHILSGHADDVTSLLCWDTYLLSGSLDKRIKVWAATECGEIKEVYEHKVDDGVIAFGGLDDSNGKPILLSSCKDNTVRLYDLPSFAERGRIFSRAEVGSIQLGPGHQFFTGDAAGTVYVWKLH